jgi:hypothetical protein
MVWIGTKIDWSGKEVDAQANAIAAGVEARIKAVAVREQEQRQTKRNDALLLRLVVALVVAIAALTMIANYHGDDRPGAQRSQAQQWFATVQPKVSAVLAPGTLGGCGTGSLDACYQDVRARHVAVKPALDYLVAHPAPACIAETAAMLKQVLDLIDRSFTQMEQGLQTSSSDPNRLRQMDSAIEYMEQAQQ